MADEDLATLTIDLLETRLRRIEYVIHGNTSAKKDADVSLPATQRLADLIYGLDRLSSTSRPVQDLLKLYAQHPDFFDDRNSSETSSLDTASKAAIVLASASSFPQTASSLISILDTPIPSAESSARLIDTKAQVAKLEMLQDSQGKSIASLKERSAAILQRWYSVDILQSGEYWADAEARVGLVEQGIRRTEIARSEEDKL